MNTRSSVPAFAILLTACSAFDISSHPSSRHDQSKRPIAPHAQTDSIWSGEHALPADILARNLIAQLGAQQTFGRLGWQQNPDYQPAGFCFDHWSGTRSQEPEISRIDECEEHARDLSRLFASYGTDADPTIFKSEYFWSESQRFNIHDFPQLVASWKSDGGSEDDESFLNHPVCVEPLQTGWTGSDYFYDGREHPLCRYYKLEILEAG